MIRLAALAVLALAGCTTATIDLQPNGATRVQFSRFATDAAVHVGENGIDYSSSPSAAAQQQATDALARAIGLLVGVQVIAPQQAMPTRLRSQEPPT